MQIVVNGLGEMGASLALAIKNANTNVEIIGVDRNQAALDQAAAMGLTTQTTTDLMTVAAQADVIILATPIRAIIATLRDLAQVPLKEGVLVTDTGSTKVQVMAAAQGLIKRQIAFVGGHAMAGTQKAGIHALDAHLYDGAPYFLVGDDVAAQQRLRTLLAGVGVQLIPMPAEQHDQMMAYLSDLPHVVSAALVNSTRQTAAQYPELPRYAAGGFKDTTRIGGADPQMWTDILTTNRAATLAALHSYQDSLAQLVTALEQDDPQQIYDFFAASRQLRQKFEEEMG